MRGETWLRVGAILGALAVAIGAFGAHGLRGSLERAVVSGDRTRAEADRALEVYETGVKYHMAHALALLAVGLFMIATRRTDLSLQVVGWLFVVGIVIFSGSLYLLGFTGIRWLGAITPLGGLAMIAGWVVFAWACSAGRPAAS